MPHPSTSSAYGIWSLNEVRDAERGDNWPKVIPPTLVSDIFSTDLYTGNSAGGSAQTLNTGIDLQNEGGLVWIKSRTTGTYTSFGHSLMDTERGINKIIKTHATDAETTISDAAFSFNSDGIRLAGSGYVNELGVDYVSWMFRKTAKFFDIVTYTGNGVSGRQIAHNLGSTPGCIMVKKTNISREWAVYHRSVGATHYAVINNTGPFYDADTLWNDTAPNSTQFTVGNNNSTNTNGDQYVAYLFAHNDGDGQFGSTFNQDVIKCGSFTVGGSGASVPVESINLGFEAQWVLLKRSDNANIAYAEWRLMDSQRGASASGYQKLEPSSSGSEGTESSAYMYPTSTGFDAYFPGNASYPGAGATYTYIAIRAES